jgi:hypothetical protein
MMHKFSSVACLFALATLPVVASAQNAVPLPSASSTPKQVETPLGTLHFKDGMPDDSTAAKAYDHIDSVHAEDAFYNAFAAVNMWAVRKGFVDAGINDGDVIIFSGLMDAKSLFLTANADTVYFWTFVDLSNGPIVVEPPLDSLAIADDMWWRYITDMGAPGPDRGTGGRYLLVPPGYRGPLPDGGYFVNRSRTNRVTILGRCFLENNDPKPAADRIKSQLKIYPYAVGGFGTSIADFLTGKSKLGQLAQPLSPRFVEGTGKVMNTIPPNDFSFFQMLNDAVQAEPAEALDPEIAGSFASIGIIKSRQFQPDARLRKILENSAATANAVSRVITFHPRPEEGFSYYGGDSHWLNTLYVGGYNFLAPPPHVTPEGLVPSPQDGARKLNSRIAMFYVATGITPAMVMYLPNIGSAYLGAFLDEKGEPLDGARIYSMNLPKGIPAAKFWSLTVYDNQTRSMLDTPQRFPRAGSQSYPSAAAEANSDGSTTIYFGPTAPPGKSSNWIQTKPGKGWFVLLRLYSPLQAFFDKSWRPGEIQIAK